MSEFMTGDRVRIKADAGSAKAGKSGEVAMIRTPYYGVRIDGDRVGTPMTFWEDELEAES